MSSEKGNSQKSRSERSDPLALRAVAHPVRIELLALLRRDGPLTASQCAVLLVLSPKLCSYHLGLLGRYGLVEETGEGKGRARPWRLATDGLRYVHRPQESREDTRAAGQFAQVMLARDVRLVEQFLDGRDALPAAWRNVAAMSSTPLRLTRDQLRSLRGELNAVIDRYGALDQTGADAYPVQAAVYAVPTDLLALLDGIVP